MADASNVVNPQANSANLPQLVQSLLAGSSQPVAPTPAVPTPSPIVQQNTSKWENILHGALLGLTGGLKAGLQNIQDAGTPRGPHANGLAMGEQEIKNDQARQQQQQKQQQLNYEQQREQFSDQLAARRAQQQDIFNRARTAEANLHSLQLGLAIDNAPKEAQDAYYKDQNARLKDMETAQVPDLGVVTSLSALPTFLKAHNLSIGGIVPIHVRAADGSDEIHIFQNPDAPADVNAVNRTLKSVGAQPIPAGSTISWRDAHSLIGQAQSRYATFLNQQKLQTQRDNAAMERTKYAAAHRPASSTSEPSPDEIENSALGLVNGGLTEDMIPGFAKVKPKIQAYLSVNFPNLDQNSVELTGEQRKRRDLAQNALHNLSHIQDILTRRPDMFGILAGRASRGELLAGSNDPDLTALQNYADNLALALTGAHSIRSTEAREKAEKVLLNYMHNGPQGVAASIEADRQSLEDFANLGKPHDKQGNLLVYNPKTKKLDLANPPIPSNAWIKENSKTHQRIYSIDGGKSWQLVPQQ